MLFTESHTEIRETVREFVQTEINPYADEWEEAKIFPAHELFKKLGDAGLLGLHRPEKYGGEGHADAVFRSLVRMAGPGSQIHQRLRDERGFGPNDTRCCLAWRSVTSVLDNSLAWMGFVSNKKTNERIYIYMIHVYIYI